MCNKVTKIDLELIRRTDREVRFEFFYKIMLLCSQEQGYDLHDITLKKFFWVLKPLGCILTLQTQGYNWNKIWINLSGGLDNFWKRKWMLSYFHNPIFVVYNWVGRIWPCNCRDISKTMYNQSFLRYLWFCERESQCYLICAIFFLHLMSK
jgi:hypothetical protein